MTLTNGHTTLTLPLLFIQLSELKRCREREGWVEGGRERGRARGREGERERGAQFNQTRTLV